MRIEHRTCAQRKDTPPEYEAGEMSREQKKFIPILYGKKGKRYEETFI